MLVSDDGHEVAVGRDRLRCGQQPAGGGLDGVEAGDGRVHHHADPGGVVGVDRQLRVGDRLPGRRHRELGEPRGPADPLVVEVTASGRSLHLGAIRVGQAAGVEGGDRADAGPAGEQVLPGDVPADADRGDRADAGDHHLWPACRARSAIARPSRCGCDAVPARRLPRPGPVDLGRGGEALGEGPHRVQLGRVPGAADDPVPDPGLPGQRRDAVRSASWPTATTTMSAGTSRSAPSASVIRTPSAVIWRHRTPVSTPGALGPQLGEHRPARRAPGAGRQPSAAVQHGDLGAAG